MGKSKTMYPWPTPNLNVVSQPLPSLPQALDAMTLLLKPLYSQTLPPNGRQTQGPRGPFLLSVLSHRASCNPSTFRDPGPVSSSHYLLSPPQRVLLL